MRSGARRRGRPGGSDGSCSFSVKALSLFLMVSILWGVFVFTKVTGPTTPVSSSGRQKQAEGLRHTSLVAEKEEAKKIPPGRKAKADGEGFQGPVTWNEVPPNDRYHLVFSTDCGGYQNWQSMALFLSADAVRQPGVITRIASGCTEAQKAELTKEYSKLPPRFRVHFTPNFKKDPKTGKEYDFYNKPYGLLHWLEGPLGPPDDSVVALLDPDFIFLRPLLYRPKDDRVLFSPTLTQADVFEEVVEGRPVAQHYGLGAQWTRFNLKYIAGQDSPALKVNISAANKGYSVGPPLIAHQRDMRKIAAQWVEFVPRVYEEYPHLLAEMYTYCIAAAHHKLPHLRLDHYMVSAIDSGGEGWPFVDRMPGYVCADRGDPGLDQPVFLHYCQFYRVEHWGFHKRRVQHDLFSCEAPLFKIPPEDLEDTHWKEDPYKKTMLSKRQARHHAYQLCELTKRLNKASMKYKAMFCEPSRANFTRAIKIW